MHREITGRNCGDTGSVWGRDQGAGMMRDMGCFSGTLPVGVWAEPGVAKCHLGVNIVSPGLSQVGKF